MKKEIFMAEYFGKNIFTRNSISSFFDQTNSTSDQEITLNFSNVEFISRSCADEYLKQKAKTRKKIIELEVSQEVYLMFKSVEDQYKKKFEVSCDISCSSNLLVA